MSSTTADPPGLPLALAARPRARSAATAFVPSLRSWPAALAAPFSRHTWLAIGQLGLSAIVGLALPILAIGAFSVIASGVWFIVGAWLPSGADVIGAMVLLLVISAIVLTAGLALVPAQSRAMRWLSAQFDGEELAGVKYAPIGPRWGRGLLALWSDSTRWIEVGRITLAGVVAAIGWLASFGLAVAAVLYAAEPLAYLWLDAKLSDVITGPAVSGAFIAEPAWVNLVFFAVLAYLAAFATQALAHGYQVAAHRLLAPLKGRELAERVVVLQRSRSDVVDAADSERKRIERDLHDGAQQRLVALSLDLGLARRQVVADPAAGPAALEHAQREVEASLAELRALVRGIYPQVLTERGLHEATEALVTRSALPASLVSPGPGALSDVPSAVSSAAYFVISECLTNAAAHGSARSVLVTIERSEDQLTLSVIDDGGGGARLRPGGGLDGLRRRVAALDGSMVLTSPAGAGTTVRVVFPCAS